MRESVAEVDIRARFSERSRPRSEFMWIVVLLEDQRDA